MDIDVFKKLLEQQLISEQEFENIQGHKNKPVSVFWDLRTLLYLGIVLLTTSVGILIYKNIDTIGHQAMVIIIAAVCIACFGYCIKNSKGYSNKKIESPNTWFDYVLLLGCLLLLTFIGYIQFQYNFFGNRWGMAAFIPMAILFITAYYFDHLGVLSLAITNLATWVGLTVTPLHILEQNDFNNVNLIYSGLLLGAGLVAMAFAVKHKNFKAHFSFTYQNFGAHILFISLLAALFHFDKIYLLWFLALAGISFMFFKNAIKERSFYFLVITLLYLYIGLSYVVVKIIFKGDDILAFYLAIIYFIVSGIALIRIFMHYNKIMKKNAGVQ